MYCACKKGSRIYHNASCGFSKHINKKNKIYFASRREAEACGYHSCMYCSSVGKAYLQQRKRLKEYCEKRPGYECHWERGRIAISTPVDHWLIFYNTKDNTIEVYHENLMPGSIFSDVPGYHRQNLEFHSVLKTMRYIYAHTRSYLNRKKFPDVLKDKILAVKEKTPFSPLSKRNRRKRERKQKNRVNYQHAEYVLDLIHYVSSKKKDE